MSLSDGPCGGAGHAKPTDLQQTKKRPAPATEADLPRPKCARRGDAPDEAWAALSSCPAGGDGKKKKRLKKKVEKKLVVQVLSKKVLLLINMMMKTVQGSH